ncbi:MAG: Ig-like domain-containing protein [Marinilabiliales bacterium]|nr:Ig-like domain-containing protein [Marinilabiliales bacterium]
MRRTCIYLFLPLLLFLLLMVRCANMVSPEGGPKDMTPPTVTGCDPPNYSVHFDGRTIRIDFDEFVNAETSGDKVLVSSRSLSLPITGSGEKAWSWHLRIP